MTIDFTGVLFSFNLFGLLHNQYANMRTCTAENSYISMNKHVKYGNFFFRFMIIQVYNIVGYAKT